MLVFTESRDTLEALQAELGREGIEALGYHGDLPLVERDRQVARFRDPEGPQVLLCTEVGGEGRNFQFAHHLVHYDLPWSPATVEQRIGRLDRIGQTKPVEIHVFDPAGTLASDVLMLLADAVGVFGETVGGLDAVLEEVEDRLAELALLPREARVAYAAELKAKVEAARAQVKRAYDPLLDLRSFDKPAVERLVARAQARMGMEADEEEEEQSLEDGLWGVARDLDERLEETVTELAKRVGIGVDTDEQVEAFQCAFHFGHALKVEALPGLDVMEDRTVLGTFWRDTAVEAEELEYFATGHSLVEALFGFLRDGPYGRSGFRFLEKRGPLKARGLELLYHVQLPEPEDTSPGARVPSRQLARFLERTLLHVAVAEAPGGAKADASLLPVLEAEGRALKGDEVTRAFPDIRGFVDAAVPVGQKTAEAELGKLAAKAKKAIEAERDAAVQRMRLSLGHQGLSCRGPGGAARRGAPALRAPAEGARRGEGGARLGLRLRHQPLSAAQALSFSRRALARPCISGSMLVSWMDLRRSSRLLGTFVFSLPSASSASSFASALSAMRSRGWSSRLSRKYASSGSSGYFSRYSTTPCTHSWRDSASLQLLHRLLLGLALALGVELLGQPLGQLAAGEQRVRGRLVLLIARRCAQSAAARGRRAASGSCSCPRIASISRQLLLRLPENPPPSLSSLSRAIRQLPFRAFHSAASPRRTRVRTRASSSAERGCSSSCSASNSASSAYAARAWGTGGASVSSSLSAAGATLATPGGQPSSNMACSSKSRWRAAAYPSSVRPTPSSSPSSASCRLSKECIRRVRSFSSSSR